MRWNWGDWRFHVAGVSSWVVGSALAFAFVRSGLGEGELYAIPFLALAWGVGLYAVLLRRFPPEPPQEG